jgi:hypothetical protein
MSSSQKKTPHTQKSPNEAGGGYSAEGFAMVLGPPVLKRDGHHQFFCHGPNFETSRPNSKCLGTDRFAFVV